MNELPAIELVDLTIRFGHQTVLENVSLKLECGKITTIIGKSGIGKSVLLKQIAGLLKPTSGKVLINGKKQDKVHAKLNYLFQNNALFDSITVFENVALPLKETSRLKKKQIEEKVHYILRELDLDTFLEKYPIQISGGMQKRVALARALVTEPEIVLFDEPTTGLDPIRRNNVFDMIARYQKQFHFTAVLVSHDIPDVYKISENIAVLDNKTIVFFGKPEELEHFQFAEGKKMES